MKRTTKSTVFYPVVSAIFLLSLSSAYAGISLHPENEPTNLPCSTNLNNKIKDLRFNNGNYRADSSCPVNDSDNAQPAHPINPNYKALVIGNDNYSGKLSRLTNPTHDAQAIASALRDIGFSVTIEKNLSHEAFRSAMDHFADSLQPTDIAFIYYAGHGLAYKNSDYLLPISPEISGIESVEFNAMNAQEILNRVSAKSQHTVFVVDSCRDNPFIRSGGGRGVGMMKPSRGSSYVFYAANLGEFASDNGTFARVLAEELRKPQSIDDIRAKVLKVISEQTNGEQNPNAINRLTVSTLYFLESDTQKTAQAEPQIYSIATQPTPQPHGNNSNKDNYNGNDNYSRQDYQINQFYNQTPPQNNVISAQKLYQLGKVSFADKNYLEARSFYERAARQGYVPAQNDLGNLYRQWQNHREAILWYEKAATQGYAEAQFNLGVLYEYNLKDLRQAKIWYEKAAQQGHAQAQNNLGALYEYNAKDYRQAKFWYEKAAATGHVRAKSALIRLN